MAAKGEDRSWLGNATEERRGLDSISVRISTMEARDAFKRQQVGGGGGAKRGGEGDDYSGCFPRGRGNMGRTVYSDSMNVKGPPFARLEAHQDLESVRARLLGAIYCCCGQPDYTEEVRAVDLKSSGGISKQYSSASSKWEDIDLSDKYCKPTPYWKQLARRAKAHVHVQQAHPSGGDWLNYDLHSYQMNFDDGCRRDDGVSSLYIDANDDSVSRERAMQSALLRNFAASGAERTA